MSSSLGTWSTGGAAAAARVNAMESLAWGQVLSVGQGGGRGGSSMSVSSSMKAALQSPAPKLSLTEEESVRGGADASSDGSINLLGLSVTAQARAVFCMAVAMACHYLSYSLARPTTLALFTSSTVGFAHSPGAFPLAMACISPTSLLLLFIYTNMLDAKGPRKALRGTTLMCSLVLSTAAGLVAYLSKSDSTSNTWMVRTVVGALFVYRESYVQLLTSQYWSFICSTLTPSQGSTWFAPISGLTSVTSATAGLLVKTVIDSVGLTGAVAMAGVVLLFSILAAEQAYAISETYGFNPAAEHFAKKKKENESTTPIVKQNMISKATALFARVPTLWALFCEILAAQGLSTLLNVCFVAKLSTAVPEDDMRAGWMGKFYALINVVSCCLQFGVLPQAMSKIEPSLLWRVMPIIMATYLFYQSVQPSPSLYLVSGALFLFKTLEFSIRRMLDEMVYVPLDFESRFVGKEVIGVFGYRFGKSGMSLALSGLTSIFGNFGISQLSYLTTGASTIWLLCAWRLSTLVPTRAEAEEVYAKNKQEGSSLPKKGH